MLVYRAQPGIRVRNDKKSETDKPIDHFDSILALYRGIFNKPEPQEEWEEKEQLYIKDGDLLKQSRGYI